MNRRRLLAATLVAVTPLLPVLLVPGGVSAAPAPDPAGPAGPVAPIIPEGDRDADRVSDDFAPRLRAAAAGDRVEVIVMGVGADAAQRAVGRVRVSHRLPLIDGFSATMTAAQARALARHPQVRRVAADGVMRALDDATNADYGATAALTDRAGLSGLGIGICVVDTGVAPDHEQIAPRPVTFRDFVGSRTTAYDDHGHGTHVMSIAAGDGTGGAAAATYAGVATAADLYAAKVLDASGFGSDSQVIAGIQWCHGQPGVRVISMSLGDTTPSDGTDPVSAAVDAAAAGGDVVVVATGNSGDGPGTVNTPAVAAGAVAVGAASDWSAPSGAPRRDDGIWLAAFSSRGPTVDGRLKPDITGPGVTVTAARSGTVSGYATYSGTSMATPYVAGAVALALQAVPAGQPAPTPGQVRSALLSTAADRGPAGADPDWGAGLVDVRAFVDAVAGATPVRRTAFPAWSRHSGTVPGQGSVDVPIPVSADGVGIPLAVTLTVTSGELICDVWCQIGLTLGEWTPDLDVELRGPDGTLLAESQCALAGVSCSTGRQETVGIVPQVAGTYTLRVYAWLGGSGAGGDFDVDVSRGPVGSPPPPPPPSNVEPVADAGPDQSLTLGRKTGTATVTLDGTGSYDPDGTITAYRWTGPSGAVVGTGARTTVTVGAAGTFTYTLRVTDDAGAHDSDALDVVVADKGGKGGGKPPRR